MNEHPLVLICLGCDHRFIVDGDIPDIHSRDSEDAMCPKCYGLDTTSDENER